MDGKMVYQLLLVNLAVNLAMQMTEHLPVKSVVLQILIRLIDLFLVVFVLCGAVFQMFPFRSFQVLVISAFLLVVYFLVSSLYYLRDQSDAERINQRIRSRSKKNEK